jgi:peptidyl-tRNA hydrolase ICT1
MKSQLSINMTVLGQCRRLASTSKKTLELPPHRWSKSPSSSLSRGTSRASYLDHCRIGLQSLRSLHSTASRFKNISSEPESGETEEEQAARAAWASQVASSRSLTKSDTGLRQLLVPKSVFEVSFSRSSGPGGQNVNKLATKAQVRMNLSAAGNENGSSSSKSIVPLPVPRNLIELLRTSSPNYYVASSHSLLFTSQASRSAEANLDDAAQKMLNHLHSIGVKGIKGVTSEAQKEKVEKLAEKEKRRMAETKKRRGLVKQSRGKVYD